MIPYRSGARYMPGRDPNNPEIGERWVKPGQPGYLTALRRDAAIPGDERAKKELREYNAKRRKRKSLAR